MRKINKNILEKVNRWSDKIDGSNFEPLKIKLNFKTGRMGNSFLFFDSIISHRVMENVLANDFYNLSADHDERIHIDIPVKKLWWSVPSNKYPDGYKDYFYACGGIFDIPNNVQFFTKRFDESSLHLIKEKKVKSNAGTFKDYKMPALYSGNKIYEIDVIGDYELICDLFIPHGFCFIGKKTAIGWGECEIIIERSTNFELNRPIPIEYAKQNNIARENIIYSAYKPPYYGRYSKEVDCYI
jgi:hypothetical protein